MNTTDPTRSDFAGPCPRCGKGVPSDDHAGDYPGALSRLDNKTYICSQCGSDEAMFQFASGSTSLPPIDQPLR